MSEKQEFWRNGQWKFTLIVMALIALFPLGLILAYITDEPNWLILCGVLFLFLS